MHNYSINTGERKIIIACLAIASVFLNTSLQSFFKTTTIPIQISVPSVMACFGIFYFLFDKFIWEIKFLHTFGLVKTPNLNGIWEGELFSSFDDNSTSNKIKITIEQTWTDISIRLATNASESESFLTGILTDNPNESKLIYQYSNTPKPTSIKSMQMHKGTTLLKFNNKDELEGEYYSGRGRANIGTIKVIRQSS